MKRTRARELARICRRYSGADNTRAVLLLVTSLAGLLGFGALSVAAVQLGVWWVLPVTWVGTAIFLMRLFSIQHDCGHGSYVSSRTWNDHIGRLISLFTVTPYSFWRQAHNLHHATTGNLDTHGVGDVFTLSVGQFQALDEHDQQRYLRFRRPWYLILVGAPLQFLVRYRTPWLQRLPAKDHWKSFLGLDIGLVLLYAPLACAVGPLPIALAVLPTLILTTWLGGWMFYMQHQFERGHYRSAADWDFHEAALYGSSFYDLPPVLHWCTGNVGLHHVHHLCSRIPMYRLQECLREVPELRSINALTLRGSLRSLSMVLWDEEEGRMLSVAEARRLGRIPI